MWFRFAFTLVFIGTILPAHAKDYSVPILIPNTIVNNEIRERVFNNNNAAWISGAPGECNYLKLVDPQFVYDGNTLTINSETDFLIGAADGDYCRVIFEWQGTTRTTGKFSVSQDGKALVFNVSRSRAIGKRLSHFSSRLLNWLQSNYYPRLNEVEFDFQPALNRVSETLNRSVENGPAGIFNPPYLTNIHSETDHLMAELHLGISARGEVHLSEYQPPLTDAELEKLALSWNRWERFITHIITRAAANANDPALRQELFNILIDSRYRIVEILSTDFEADQYDPVQHLFIDVWKDLKPILNDIYAHEHFSDSYLQLISFASASESIHAISEIGPRFGVEISQNGLRNLARMLTNEDVGFDENPPVDDSVRELFQFEPEPLKEESGVQPKFNWLDLIAPRAVAQIPKEGNIVSLLLNQIVATKDNLTTYLPLVLRVLERATEYVLANNSLTLQQELVYRSAVPATAWKESCWRQFIYKNGEIRVLTSSAKAVGIMQVTPYVWRDFYDSYRLKNDALYNIYAGSEILMHYFRDYAIRKGEHRHRGNIDNLAYASYAAYNGGPRHLSRYRQENTKNSLKKIDAKYKQYYKDIATGKIQNILLCYGLNPDSTPIDLRLTALD